MDYEIMADRMISSMILLNRSDLFRGLSTMSNGETFILLHLIRAGKALQPGELSEKMKISTASVSATLRTLEKKGLVSREIDLHDRRHINVTITEAGRKQGELARYNGREQAKSLLQKLSEEECEAYVSSIENVLRVMQQDGAL